MHEAVKRMGHVRMATWARALLVRLWRTAFVRQVILALTALLLIILAIAPLATTLGDSWARRDIELRSRLVFRSIRTQVTSGLAATPVVNPTPFFEQLAEDERILALGLCDVGGQLQYATRLMPKSVTCAGLPAAAMDTFSVISSGADRYHVGIFPLGTGEAAPRLLILHDLGFVDVRAGEVRRYTILALVGVVLGFGLLTAAIVLAFVRGWTQSLRDALLERRGGAARTGSTRPIDLPISREVQALLGDLRIERKYTDGIQVQWSPATLHRLLVEELPDTEVLIVSNREPYIHNRTPEGIRVQRPASGLVAALEPVMRACGGTWIAHGSGTADRDTVDANDRLPVPPEKPSYTLRRVWISDEEQDGYYYGFSNEGLWPLCHIAFVRPTFREGDWSQYVAINARFADVIVREAKGDAPVVLVQDYHFALLPRMIRERLPKATIIFFWHIPWPNAETFGICPWRAQIIDGLLGSLILGFHTQLHCNNFLESVDRFMESRIDREKSAVVLGGEETLIRPYPISIEWPPAALADVESVEACRERLRRRLGLAANIQVIVGIERFDYTKGILERMRAMDELLLRQPHLRGRVVLVQAAAPTRSKLPAYRALQEEAVRLSEEVNRRNAGTGAAPIALMMRHHEPSEVYELFRGADACIVSSLHDGMNLVAKEFVAARDDEQGVLILSSFAGASSELSEALIVNPYDAHGMAQALYRALSMSPGEQRERMSLMRSLVRQRNVYRWAAQMLLDGARLRKREALGGFRGVQ